MKKKIAMTGGILAAMIADAAGLSRQDLEKKLQQLAKEPAPTKLAPGAMCYDMAMPLQRQEFVCPACGKKTLYATGSGIPMPWALFEADTYRRLVIQLKAKGLECTLDETAFCQDCGKNVKDKRFVLVVTKNDKTAHRTQLKSTEDLQVLVEFLEGKSKHAGAQGRETALKDYLPRIRELLGLASQKEPEKK